MSNPPKLYTYSATATVRWEMLDENKRYFRKILHDFINRYPFNPALFPSESEETPAP